MYTGRSEAACSLEGPVAEASPMEERKAFWAAGEQGDPCPFAFTRTYWFQRRHTLFSRLYQLWMESGAQCSDGPVLPLEQPSDACEASQLMWALFLLALLFQQSSWHWTSLTQKAHLLPL